MLKNEVILGDARDVLGDMEDSVHHNTDVGARSYITNDEAYRAGLGLVRVFIDRYELASNK